MLVGFVGDTTAEAALAANFYGKDGGIIWYHNGKKILPLAPLKGERGLARDGDVFFWGGGNAIVCKLPQRIRLVWEAGYLPLILVTLRVNENLANRGYTLGGWGACSAHPHCARTDDRSKTCLSERASEFM